jgi:hypothetical protein
MHRRTRRTLISVAAAMVLLAVAIFLRSKAPPEAARLLPESDGIVYVNLKPFRTLLRHAKAAPPQRVPEYQEFVNATGIDWEKDLDQAAIALHRMPDPRGPNGPVAYSMVLVGKITGPRLNSWLAGHATSRDTYSGHTIYDIPSEGRTVRVSQIGYDMIAVSNTPTPEQIHSIIERRGTAAWPFAGSTLLRQHFHEVPLLAFAWGVGQIGLPFSQNGAISIFGFQLPLQTNSTIVASVSPSLPLPRTLRLRVEEIAPDEQAAASQSASLATLITMARGFTQGLASNPANNGLRELLSTAVVTQRHDRVVVSATVSPRYLSDLSSGAEGPVTSPSSGIDAEAPSGPATQE